MRARARAGADQDVHAEILQRRVEHLLHVGQQAVDLVDEEDLARLDVAEDAGEIELLLQNRAGGLLEADAQLRGDDGGERGLAQARRAVEQHVIHGLAALARGFDGDGEVLLQLGLAGEIGQPPRAKRRFELPIVFLDDRRKRFPVGHVLTSLPYQFQRAAEERFEFGGRAGGLGFAHRRFGLRARAAQVEQRREHVLVDCG